MSVSELSRQELLPDTWLCQLKRLDDVRGHFVKTYGRTSLRSSEFNFDCAEEFYSVSHKNVLRGMHFQLPPHDHVKLVYCAAGAVKDVLLDLRRGPGYGKVAAVELREESPALLVIPRGVAHGFLSLRDGSLMVYKTSTEHAPSHDAGIRWNSFGFDWGVGETIISDRDSRHVGLNDFESPFGSSL